MLAGFIFKTERAHFITVRVLKRIVKFTIASIRRIIYRNNKFISESWTVNSFRSEVLFKMIAIARKPARQDKKLIIKRETQYLLVFIILLIQLALQLCNVKVRPAVRVYDRHIMQNLNSFILFALYCIYICRSHVGEWSNRFYSRIDKQLKDLIKHLKTFIIYKKSHSNLSVQFINLFFIDENLEWEKSSKLDFKCLRNKYCENYNEVQKRST